MLSIDAFRRRGKEDDVVVRADYGGDAGLSGSRHPGARRARIRQPSYLGLFILTLGWALAFRSAVGVLLWALTVPPLVSRICAEEALLSSEFGDAYAAYRARTARLIPDLY